MVDTRPTGSGGNIAIRPDGGSGRSAPGRATEDVKARYDPRARIPSLRQLASLIIDGVLTLPPNYRRGMYLDVLV
jgi:hypothetical protein